MLWMREDVTAEREGWKSEVKDWSVANAAVWDGEGRRLGSMVEGAGGEEGRGGRRTALSGGGRRRDSHVWRSVCRLDYGTMSASVVLREGWKKGTVHTGRFVAPSLVSWLDLKRS